MDLRSTALRMSAGRSGIPAPGLSRSPRRLVARADRSGGTFGQPGSVSSPSMIVLRISGVSLGFAARMLSRSMAST